MMRKIKIRLKEFAFHLILIKVNEFVIYLLSFMLLDTAIKMKMERQQH